MNDNYHIHRYDSESGIPPTEYTYGLGKKKTGAVMLFCECGANRTFTPFRDENRVILTDRKRESAWRGNDISWEEYITYTPEDQGFIQCQVPRFRRESGCPYPSGTKEYVYWHRGVDEWIDVNREMVFQQLWGGVRDDYRSDLIRMILHAGGTSVIVSIEVLARLPYIQNNPGLIEFYTNIAKSTHTNCWEHEMGCVRFGYFYTELNEQPIFVGPTFRGNPFN